MASSRAIVLRDTNGEGIRTIDISDLDHDNPAAPYAISIETRCDLGAWHQGEHVNLACWGPRVSADPSPS